jgi:Fe-Mn family superoxide dismutase
MFTVPALKYPFNAIEPHIDAKTMEIHHDKHHAAYVNNLNNALKGKTDLESKSIEQLITKISNIPEDIRGAVRNNGGGHWNHSFFWDIIGPNKGGSPKGRVGEAIDKTFGTYDAFKEQFTKAAVGRFGSGWAWLVVQNGKLVIGSTPNQDNPLMDISDLKGVPILGVDVWEHAYYLLYQNRRPDYLTAFYNTINWDIVEANYSAALK